jgi:hypothetical protein
VADEWHQPVSPDMKPVVPEFRYLGIVFHQTKGYLPVSALQSAGMRAMWGMLSMCGSKGIRSVEVQVQLLTPLPHPSLDMARKCGHPLCCVGAQLLRHSWTMICTVYTAY